MSYYCLDVALTVGEGKHVIGLNNLCFENFCLQGEKLVVPKAKVAQCICMLMNFMVGMVLLVHR